MKEKWSSTGGVLSAFLSSVCCIGPLIFSALGVGAGATGILGKSAHLAAWMTPYRPYFVLLTFVFLGLGFYSVYKKEKVCHSSSDCSPERLKKAKLLLWAMTLVSVVLVIAPFLLAIGS